MDIGYVKPSVTLLVKRAIQIQFDFDLIWASKFKLCNLRKCSDYSLIVGL